MGISNATTSDIQTTRIVNKTRPHCVLSAQSAKPMKKWVEIAHVAGVRDVIDCDRLRAKRTSRNVRTLHTRVRTCTRDWRQDARDRPQSKRLSVLHLWLEIWDRIVAWLYHHLICLIPGTSQDVDKLNALITLLRNHGNVYMNIKE